MAHPRKSQMNLIKVHLITGKEILMHNTITDI